MNATATSLAPDAAMALGIAATAMPFARTPEDEAERWLRVLRLHGDSGAVLQALGVSEGPLSESDGSQRVAAHHGARPGEDTVGADTSPGAGREHAGDPRRDENRDVVADVTAQAAELAGRRGATGVGTRDLLAAVIQIYGEHFDRVLRAHGTDSREVLERLAA
jgi:hypothetical protein